MAPDPDDGAPGRMDALGGPDAHSSAPVSREWIFYGHVGAVPGRRTIMVDGNLTDDLILWMDYDDPKQPRIEVICRHGTDWNGHEWQYPHPHPQCDPTGARIVYNAAERGRSDVFVVEV